MHARGLGTQMIGILCDIGRNLDFVGRVSRQHGTQAFAKRINPSEQQTVLEGRAVTCAGALALSDDMMRKQSA